MSEKRNLDPQFKPRVDAYIALANQHCNSAQVGEVRASLLFAAARFNAFTVASMAPNAQVLKAGTQHAVDFFTDEFRKMLEDNLRDQTENFAAYFTPTKGNA